MKRHDERFDQLLARARQGDENAVHDLFAEYQFDASAELRPQLPKPEESETKNTHQEK